MARHPRDAQLTLTLPTTGEALRHRIAEAIIDAIRLGWLHPGDALPPTRVLAAELGVARSGVVEAYDELCAAGYACARPGSGTLIAPGADAAAAAGAGSHVSDRPTTVPDTEPTTAAPTWDLTPGCPDTGLVSPEDWRRAWRAAAAAPIHPRSAGPTGHPELRHALAVHLRRTRGILAHPDELVLVPGVDSALRTLAAAADLAGRDIAFEEPGYRNARRALEMSGARLRPVGIDTDGLDPAALRDTDAAVYCTPAHQYPLGARMPVTRRADLLARAAESGTLIIEDDYDGEFRYDVSALPALRSVEGGREHVAYIGTASKIISPSIRLAWLLPPPALLPRVHDSLRRTGENCCGVTGLALAHFIESGALTRHLARASRTYSARRAALVDALRSRPALMDRPGVHLAGIEAGLHMVLRLPDRADDDAIAAELGTRGIAVPGLGRYRTDAAGPRGLMCGYAQLPESQADAVAGAIADVVGRHLAR
ncbi:MocR-like pyridoxine biosynthesis transcription factor PdxR [Rhodococcus sp. UNC363MFTsu5.1]|uniref:MocR-like pyridoxine biosynthesis transcription factor PdxR n=1 Tax=Rhodococcus sp. UNC363MFTsu5.1 TaxID=1449069 RepID=UPI000480675A|nr:PLP-dependent aminotransferase family protein [Rhodococcus sp. UNC363MFTsu5.1]